MAAVTISGAAARLIVDADAHEEIDGALVNISRYVADGTRKRHGRGYRVTFEAPRAVLVALADYLDSVADAVGSMTAAERDGGREHVTSAAASAVIRAALAELDESLTDGKAENMDARNETHEERRARVDASPLAALSPEARETIARNAPTAAAMRDADAIARGACVACDSADVQRDADGRAIYCRSCGMRTVYDAPPSTDEADAAADYPPCQYCGAPLTENERDAESGGMFSAHWRCTCEAADGAYSVRSWLDGAAYGRTLRYSTRRRADAEARHLARSNGARWTFAVDGANGANDSYRERYRGALLSDAERARYASGAEWTDADRRAGYLGAPDGATFADGDATRAIRDALTAARDALTDGADWSAVEHAAREAARLAWTLRTAADAAAFTAPLITCCASARATGGAYHAPDCTAAHEAERA